MDVYGKSNLETLTFKTQVNWQHGFPYIYTVYCMKLPKWIT